MNTVTLEDLKREKRIVRDGERLVVPMFAMDSVQRGLALRDALGRPAGHRPAHAIAPPTEQSQLRDAAFEAAGVRLREAWKNPAPVAPKAGVTGTPANRTTDAPARAADAEAAWERQGEALRNAWRSPQ